MSERALEIDTYIGELYKVLKLEGLCSSGGEAKLVIADGKVNGEIETRKRKKILNEDLIGFSGEKKLIRRKDQTG